MSSPPARLDAGDPPAHPDAGNPASQPIFRDEILGEIFLRRNRSLYRQRVVGFLEYEGPTPRYPRPFYHAEPPHRSASDARDLTEAADFTCSFLPNPGSWRVLEATGGRLLLSSDSSDNTTGSKDLVVCDPLQRRYVRIPSVPVDLKAGMCMSTSRTYYSYFFAPTGEEEGSSFRVTSMFYDHDYFFAPTGDEEGLSFRDHDKMKVTAFVFSSATGQWCKVTFDGWDMNRFIAAVHTSCRYHPKISLYQSSRLFNEVLMLDTHKMEFSMVRTPLVGHPQQHAIIEAGEGRLGFLTIVNGMLDLYCKACQDNGVSVEEWQHQKTIPIPLPDSDGYSISFCGTGDGYLLIQAIPPDSAEAGQMPEIHYFTLNVKTLLVERLCMLNKRINVALLYTNFLPPLSLPSV